MYRRLSFVCLVALFVCSGCLTNYYEKYYVSTAKCALPESDGKDAAVELRVATTEDDVVDLMEHGYVSIGYSSFAAPYTAMSMVVDTARRHGATLALVDIRYRETQKYTSVLFLPSMSRSYTTGNIGGYSYSATTDTTTMNAVPVQREREIYDHDALFFRKVEIADDYGVRLFVPKRLPTEKPDAPVCVRVLAVLRGSRAEHDGIKRGQVVVRINDAPITTRKDVMPFLHNLNGIVSMEVRNAE